MSWYGWIPVLTSNLLVEQAVGKLRITAISTKIKNNYILPPKIEQTETSVRSGEQLKNHIDYFDSSIINNLKDHFNLSSEDEVFYYLRDFDDKEHSKLSIVALSLNQNYTIKQIGLFNFPESKLKAFANINYIESTGLVQYKLTNGTLHIYAKQLFGEIRNIYHEHVYASHGDFALRPVHIKGEDKNEAIIKIFEQYQLKILTYHKYIKNKLSDMKSTDSSSQDLYNLHSIISSGKGEMVYALSFVNLFDLKEKEKQSIKNSLKSLQILSEKFDNLVEFKEMFRNWKIFFLTFIATIYASFNILETIWPSYGWLSFVICAIFFPTILHYCHCRFFQLIQNKKLKH